MSEEKKSKTPLILFVVALSVILIAVFAYLWVRSTLEIELVEVQGYYAKVLVKAKGIKKLAFEVKNPNDGKLHTHVELLEPTLWGKAFPLRVPLFNQNTHRDGSHLQKGDYTITVRPTDPYIPELTRELTAPYAPGLPVLTVESTPEKIVVSTDPGTKVITEPPIKTEDKKGGQISITPPQSVNAVKVTGERAGETISKIIVRKIDLKPDVATVVKLPNELPPPTTVSGKIAPVNDAVGLKVIFGEQNPKQEQQITPNADGTFSTTVQLERASDPITLQATAEGISPVLQPVKKEIKYPPRFEGVPASLPAVAGIFPQTVNVPVKVLTSFGLESVTLAVAPDETSVTTIPGIQEGVPFDIPVQLQRRENNRIILQAMDKQGYPSLPKEIRIQFEPLQSPRLVVTAPAENEVTKADEVTVTGRVEYRFLDHLELNGEAIRSTSQEQRYEFDYKVPLQEGKNDIPVGVTDKLYNLSDQKTITVFRDQTPPYFKYNGKDVKEILLRADQGTVLVTVTDDVAGLDKVQADWQQGYLLPPSSRVKSQTVPIPVDRLKDGENRLTAVDAVGNPPSPLILRKIPKPNFELLEPKGDPIVMSPIVPISVKRTGGSDSATLTIDGSTQPLPRDQIVKTDYRLPLREGEQTIKLFLKDEIGYQDEMSIHVTKLREDIRRPDKSAIFERARKILDEKNYSETLVTLNDYDRLGADAYSRLLRGIVWYRMSEGESDTRKAYDDLIQAITYFDNAYTRGEEYSGSINIPINLWYLGLCYYNLIDRAKAVVQEKGTIDKFQGAAISNLQDFMKTLPTGQFPELQKQAEALLKQLRAKKR